MMERATREGWLQGERREVIEIMLRDMRNASTVRDRTAAARVLAALERNQIAAARNEVQDQGQAQQEQTARMRAALSTPEGRAAMAAATVAMMGEQQLPHVG